MSVGAVAMSLSTIIVAANAQLLRRLKLQCAVLVPGAVGAWLLGWPIPSVPDRLVSTGGGRIKQPSSGRPFEERPESVLSCWDGAACPVDD